MAQFSKSSVVHCPHGCGKPVLSQIAIWEGSTFMLRCPNADCRGYVRIQVTKSVVLADPVTDPKERAVIDHG